MDREPWQATVHGVAKNRTRLSANTQTYLWVDSSNKGTYKMCNSCGFPLSTTVSSG